MKPLSRHSLRASLLAPLLASIASLAPRPSSGAPRVFPGAGSVPLSERLRSRDAAALSKTAFNFAPPEAIFPSWLAGEWHASLSFDGYELPVKDLVSREALFAEPTVPGFQKCSIAFLPDVGREGVAFPMRWAEDAAGAVREDRAANLRAAIRGGLGYDAVERVEYKEDPMIPNPFGVNPNRLAIVFASGLTLNAERIELFVNSRETQEVSSDLFLMSESVRQVTFSASRTSVARQVSGEYAHYFTFKRLADGSVTGNILTAAYADPLQQERFFIKVGPRPLIIFSHRLRLQRSS
ncbi:hypothetical protein AB1Y20_022303 [Prymnesium parvum]|uniref:DUF6816 domain-containing protein n=1 Tax=Prymnesium parvum TaxID=97485 RepID=A0AB34JIJ5_PRYPA